MYVIVEKLMKQRRLFAQTDSKLISNYKLQNIQNKTQKIVNSLQGFMLSRIIQVIVMMIHIRKQSFIVLHPAFDRSLGQD